MILWLVAVFLLGWVASEVWRRYHERTQTVNGSEWVPGTVTSYAPMARLLDDSEFTFLVDQRGYRPGMAARLRRQRRAIFRLYLGQLRAEFLFLHREATGLLLASGYDRPDLTWRLSSQRLRFYWLLAGVHSRLALHACGIGRVPVGRLLQVADEMRGVTAQLAAAAA